MAEDISGTLKKNRWMGYSTKCPTLRHLELATMKNCGYSI